MTGKKTGNAYGGSTRAVADLLMEQVECADTIVLNKVDCLDQNELNSVQALLRELNPHAKLHLASFGRVPLKAILVGACARAHATARNPKFGSQQAAGDACTKASPRSRQARNPPA